jgi:hypothetical protein
MTQPAIQILTPHPHTPHTTRQQSYRMGTL